MFSGGQHRTKISKNYNSFVKLSKTMGPPPPKKKKMLANLLQNRYFCVKTTLRGKMLLPLITKLKTKMGRNELNKLCLFK